MGAQQSKDELLFRHAKNGNVEGIKALRRDGAGLEWVDKDGRTPLILACTKSNLLHVAKVLIDLGARVNAYRPGSNNGTPLHHATKRDLDQTVNLLLSKGVNPFLLNDDRRTALDMARKKGNIHIVRNIENRICLFSGWLRRLHGPGLWRNRVPRKMWAVVYPNDLSNPFNPTKFDLALYSGLQVAKPVAVISLWKVQMDVPNFDQPDPALNMVDNSKKKVYKFFSALSGDKQQLQWFYNACRGIQQVNGLIQIPALAAPAPTHPTPARTTLVTSTVSIVHPVPPNSVVPSAPPIEEERFDGAANAGSVADSCMVCFNAAVEGACVPCGHMAGCMKCLNDIKIRELGCPVCHAKIQLVLKLYAV